MFDKVRITDVSPRDGLQNEPGVIPAADKVRLLSILAESGVDEIEATSFISAKWVPQLGDAAEVLKGFAAWARDRWAESRMTPLPVLSVLVPNDRGMDDVMASINSGIAIEKIAVFTAASDTFTRKNINASIADSIDRFRPVVKRAKQHSAGPILVRGYISCAIACPFEGPIAPSKVADVAQKLVELGVDEIDVADTIGAGTPETVQPMLKAVMDRLDTTWRDGHKLTLHLHDTFGRADECVKAALQTGIRSFDGSVAGLGGCPYASTPTRRAPGNIDTAALVHTVHNAGFRTSVNIDALQTAAAFARKIVVAASRGTSNPAAPKNGARP